MITTLVALSLFSKSPAIDFDHPAAPLPEIVEALGKALGTELVADKGLGRDIVIVHLDGATKEQALEWIAEVVDAKWETKNGKPFLTRTPAKEKEQERAERDARIKRVTDFIARVPEGKPLDKDSAGAVAELFRPRTTDEYAPVDVPYELRTRIPSARLFTRIAKELDFSQFADLPSGVKLYLPFDEKSADPRLSKSTLRYVADFRREDLAYGLAFEQRGIEVKVGGPYSVHPGFWEQGAFKGAIEINVDWGSPSVGMVLAWGDGFTFVGLPSQPEGSTSPIGRIVHDEWKVAPKLSAMAGEYLKLRAPSRTLVNAVATKVPQSVLDYFTVDESFDLFGLGSQDALIQAATALGKSLVACLPDAAAFAVRRLIRSPGADLQTLIDWVLNPAYAKCDEREQVLILKPTEPASARESRIPRPIVRDIVKDSLRGESDLTVYADLLASASPSAPIGDPRLTFSLVTRLLHIQDYGSESTQALRLYGMLTDGQRQAAGRDGVLVPWVALSVSQRRDLSALIGSEGMVGFPGEYGVEEGPGSEAALARLRAFKKMYSQGALIEGLLVRRKERSILVGGSTTERNVPLQTIDGMQFVWHVASHELGRADPGIDRYTILPWTEIEVSIRIDGTEHRFMSYSEAFTTETPTLFTYDKIPKAMIEKHRKEIDKAKEDIRKYDPPVATPPSRR